MSEITVDYCRALNSHELRAIAHPIAQAQAKLRAEGEVIIRGVLRALTGRVYRGTGGWHIAAYATPDGLLGYVNTAHGHAVLTDVALDPRVVQALTVPEQSEGPKFSGAAMYTAPDAGEPQHSEAPRGWLQLVLDLRGEATAVRCRAHVCAWGLRTCYMGRRGAPGERHLEAYVGGDNPRDVMPVSDWPLPADARARMHAAAEPIMQRIVLAIAAIEGLQERMQDALASGGLGAAHDLAFRHAHQSTPELQQSYGALAAVRDGTNSVTNRVIQSAMREANITRILALGGDLDRTGPSDYFRVIAYILQRALLRILAPVAEATFAAHSPLVRTARADSHAVHVLTMDMMRDMAARTLPLLLAGVVTAEDEQTIMAALYSEGYLPMNVPIRLPEVAN